VRAQPSLKLVAVESQHPEVVDVEEAVLQLDVDIVRDGLANASDRLPRKTRVGIVDGRSSIRESPEVAEPDARDTGTATDKPARAFIVAEVKHAVDHEAQGGCSTIGIVGESRTDDALARKTEGGLQRVDVGALVSDLSLNPEASEIVSSEHATVDTIIMVDLSDGVGGTLVEFDIFDDHRSEFATNVPGAIAR